MAEMTARIEAKIGSEIKTIQDKMDDGQEKMKVQIDSLVSCLDVHHAKTSKPRGVDGCNESQS
jgi:hypothetical protein